MSIQINSFNQTLGAMIRKIIAETPLNDINPGSVLLTLLEACAANDFENNTAILNVINLLNINALQNNDLDNKAGDYGLSRNAAIKASGQVTINNTNITKRSTGLYVIKPAPISGQTVIYVNNTTGWSPTGTLYIGRGTNSFEGPIAYTSITNFPTYSAIQLASALQNNHLISDSVIDSQGQTDIVVPAGTVVIIPANNQNPEIDYTTLLDAVIPAGEDHVDNVSVIAVVPGSQGNATINTITQFQTSPFSGAGVTNTSSFSNGADVETDTQLRNRLQAYTFTLARGTSNAILSAVIGVSDPTDSKQVASAIITEPVNIGNPSILYIDDGSSGGFQPSYAGQSVDQLITSANGTEEFLQLANYPVPRPQVVNTATGPFTIADASALSVIVDGEEEIIIFSNSDFQNPTAATAAEIITSFNNQSKLSSARFVNNSANILIYPQAFDAETIQIAALKPTDNATLYVNSVLQFPTDQFSYIALYQNSTRLREKAKSALLETVAFGSWNISNPGDLILSVDGTPAQDGSFGLSDFAGASSFASLTLADWVSAVNAKFAGVTAIATSAQTMQMSSNKIGSTSSLVVSGGSYIGNWFPSQALSADGQTSQFELNRQTGNLRILTDIAIGDSITAGVADAKGFTVSSSTTSGTYNVGADGFGRPAEAVIVSDSTYCNNRAVNLAIGSPMAFTSPSTNVMQILAPSLNTFSSLFPGDFIYITARTSNWVSAANSGLFKIIKKGPHTTAGTDTYIEVLNVSPTTQTVNVQDTLDIQAFTTDGFPQIWRGVYTNNPPAAPLNNIVQSFSTFLIGVKASIFKSNSIKLTSTTENNGSIAIPVSVGNAATLFTETTSAQLGNPSMVANRVSDKDLVGFFKRTGLTSQNVWLDREISVDVKGALTADATPDVYPYTGSYSEVVQSTGVLNNSKVDYEDYISFTRGNNRGQFRTVKAFIATDEVGTQEGTARTELDHIVGDEFQIVKPLEFSTDDSIVVVLDQDPTDNTVDIQMSRTGRTNSGSGGNTFIPTTTELSANDFDNEASIDFANPIVWGTASNGTNFSDYAFWMQARNWYASGGVGSGGGEMLLRSTQYGPNGNSLRFQIEYPGSPAQAASAVYVNTPSFSTYTYVFGSGTARPIAVSGGTTISVAGPYPDVTANFPAGAASTGNYFDYTFSNGNFSPVQAGDIVSIGNQSGVSTYNQGTFSVQAISSNTVRIYNPTATDTQPGTAQVTTVTTVADVPGTSTTYNVTTVADVSDSLNGTYFIIDDTAGSVGVWFDVGNTGTPQPTTGAARNIRVATVLENDTAATIATKVYQTLSNDNAFNVSATGTMVTIVVKEAGALANGTAGTSGFTVATTTGTPGDSLDGKYFIIYDDNGSCAIWFAVNNGSTPEPLHGADRSIRCYQVNSGDSANTVASAIVAAVNGDVKFSASATTDVVTITNTFLGAVPAANANTSGFTVSNTTGSLGTAEVISNPSGVSIFPLANNTVTSICATINAGVVMSAVALSSGSLTITKSTKEEQYAYSGNATALSYGHNPINSTINSFVSMYDGVNWVKSFQNANPNFTMKTAFTLQGVSSIYSMDTAPNIASVGSSGELFKLLPTSVKNVYHHLTQKALSQLPIISDVEITDDRKNVQIKSDQLGSAGAVEFIGGNGNVSNASIVGESSVATDTNGNTLLIKIPAFPDTFNQGDTIMMTNPSGVKRLARTQGTDTVSVLNPSTDVIEYTYNPKVINATSATTFTIADVSSTYDRPSGYVWRWTHGGGGVTFAQVNPGDLLYAFGTLSGWDQGNMARLTGDGAVAGLPIIAVNDGSNYIDVSNPYGLAMSSTAIGSGGTVQICPTPVIQWTLSHAAKTLIVGLSCTSNVVTVICSVPHFLHSGANVTINDSANVADGTYGPITVTGPSTFTFALTQANFSETSSEATAINSTFSPTRYRIEKLGFNGLTRLSRFDGQEPNFLDCGVALDDYIVISGTTFNSANNGTFRVLAVDNNSIIFINNQATDELDTIIPFNNKGLLATWTSNSNLLTGVAGTFKHLSVGDWVKKQEDPDSFYVQVLAMNGTGASTTQVTLGAVYQGSSENAAGISYDELNSYDTGVYLQSVNDIAVYEGDAAMIGDSLFIQDIIDANWFSPANIGTFVLSQVGTEPGTFRPFLRTTNASGVAQARVELSVNPAGMYIIESLANKFYTIRDVSRAALDDTSTSQRSLYIVPSSRDYKFSDANSTTISHLGKLGYNTQVTIGVDGYLYYTGLLQRVERIVDGFEPDAQNFPGQRAVGGLIEILPPLTKEIDLSINVVTNNGVNIGDISDNIKSTIINYIQGLGVGTEVVLSQIIANVMQIKGVQAVTFTTPTPDTVSISIASNQRATISASNISIA